MDPHAAQIYAIETFVGSRLDPRGRRTVILFLAGGAARRRALQVREAVQRKGASTPQAVLDTWLRVFDSRHGRVHQRREPSVGIRVEGSRGRLGKVLK